MSMSMNGDLDSETVKESVSLLKPLLASTFHLAFKTQIAHWNIEGSFFHMLHLLFGNQYEELTAALDDIAERIRTLGHKTDEGLDEWSQTSFLNDSAPLSGPKNYLQDLTENHNKIVIYIRKKLKGIRDSSDEGTKDLLVGRLKEHEKSIWILKSHLGN